MPRALVTGATGLVGSHVVERLVRDGWDVRAMVRSNAPDIIAMGASLVLGDALDAASFTRAATGCDVVVHAAAAVTPRGGWEAFRHLNVDGTINAIAAAEHAGAKLVHVSSVAVYGPDARYQGPSKKTDEMTQLGPLPERAFYARSKRESEQLVMAAHAAGRVWATALRPDVIYGRRDRQFVPRLARLLSHGVAPLIAGGRSTLAVVHAANVADGIVRAAGTASAGGQAYNLANDYDVTVRRFFEMAAEGLGRRIRLVTIPLGVARPVVAGLKKATRWLSGGRLNVVSNASLSFLTEDNPFSSDKARRELGWAPEVRPEIGVPDAFRWWVEHARTSSE